MLRYCTFSCTSTRAHTHTSCYKCATVHSLALPHSCLATLLYVDLHFHTQTHTHTRHATSALLYILSNFHTHVLLRYCTFSCTSTRAHTHVMLQVRYCTFSRASTLMSFYTTVLSLAVPHAHIHTHTRHATCALLCILSHLMSCYATVRSHAHTHTRHATSALLYILSRFHTPAVPRYCTLSGAFAHMSCYATVRFVCSWHATLLYAPCLPHPCHATLCIRSLALAHICHATLLYVLSHIDTRTHVML